MSDHTIDIRGVCKEYGTVRAVDGVTMQVPQGQVVSILGPNGAGKSTLIDLLLGLTSPDAGEVRVFGMSPADAVHAGTIGAMLQSTALLDDATVAELVGMVTRLHRHPLGVPETLQRAGIADLASRRSTRLSGGQRQRIAYALAIAGDPDVLVLDEPTAAMDVVSRHAFWASIREMSGSGRTVLFATHHLAEAEEFADRVIFMQGGRIIADGTVTDVQDLAAGREVSATVPAEHRDEVARLPGVVEVAWRHDRVTLLTTRSDETLRALVATVPRATAIEVSGVSLERAFLTLTAQERKVS